MTRSAILVALIAVGGFLSMSQTAHSQGGNPARRTILQHTIRRPTVSPYLNLLQFQNDFGLPNYQTLVRPQLEQRRQNQQQMRAIQQLQTEVARNTAADQRGEAALRATGHPSGFFYYSHWYPGLARRR